MDKRGIIKKAWEYLFDLFFSAVVFLSLFSFVGGLAEDTTFEMEFLARDIALMVETIYASPGNVVVDYPQNTLWFSFEIGDGQVIVYDPANPSVRAVYPYGQSKTIKLEKVTLSPKSAVSIAKTKPGKMASSVKSGFSLSDVELTSEETVKLRFVKKGDEIIIGTQEELKVNLNELICPSAEVKDEEKKVLVHPVFGDAQAGDKKKSSLTYSFALPLQQLLKSPSRESVLTRLEDQAMSAEELKNKVDEQKPDLLIVVDYNEKSLDDGVIVYYRPDDQQYMARLSCEIVNSLADRFPDMGSVTYTPLMDIGEDESKSIMNSVEHAVYIELSGKVPDAQDFAQVIYGSFGRYHEKASE